MSFMDLQYMTTNRDSPIRLSVYKTNGFCNGVYGTGKLLQVSVTAKWESIVSLCYCVAYNVPSDKAPPPDKIHLYLLPGGVQISSPDLLRENDSLVVAKTSRPLPVQPTDDDARRKERGGSPRSTSELTTKPSTMSLKPSESFTLPVLQLKHQLEQSSRNSNETPKQRFKRAVRKIMLINRFNKVANVPPLLTSKRSRKGAGGKSMDSFIKELTNIYEYANTRKAEDLKLPPLMTHAESRWKVAWDMLIFSLVLFFGFTVPYRIGFDVDLTYAEQIFEIAADVIFLIDIVVSFRTALKIDGVLVSDPQHVSIHYATTWFPFDLLASFPIGWFTDTGGVNRLIRMLRLFKLFRMLRLIKLFPKLFQLLETNIKFNPSMIRFMRSFVVMFMVWHCMGCLYYFIVREEYNGTSPCFDDVTGGMSICYVNNCLCGESIERQILPETDVAWLDSLNPDQWVLPPSYAAKHHLDQYWQSLFWAVEVTTGIGSDIIPRSNVEIGFTTVMVIVGLMLYSIIIGSAASALQNIDSTATQRRQTLDKVTAYMRSRNVPAFFQRIIVDFYEHMWSTPRQENEVFHDLPDALRSKLTIVMNRDLVHKVPVFQLMSAEVYIRMVQRMVQVTFLPGEYIIRQGEEGHHMYFILRGRVDGLLSNEVTVFATFMPGDFFGEYSLLTGNKRDAAYRAVDFLDVLAMARSDFDELHITAQRFIDEIKTKNKQRQLLRERCEEAEAAARTLTSQPSVPGGAWPTAKTTPLAASIEDVAASKSDDDEEEVHQVEEHLIKAADVRSPQRRTPALPLHRLPVDRKYLAPIHSSSEQDKDTNRSCSTADTGVTRFNMSDAAVAPSPTWHAAISVHPDEQQQTKETAVTPVNDEIDEDRQLELMHMDNIDELLSAAQHS